MREDEQMTGGNVYACPKCGRYRPYCACGLKVQPSGDGDLIEAFEAKQEVSKGRWE